MQRSICKSIERLDAAAHTGNLQPVVISCIGAARLGINPSAAERQAYRGLHAAAARGDIAEIEKLAKMGAAIDGRDGNGRYRYVQGALFDAGANVNLGDWSGATPLTLAKRRGYKEMLKFLKLPARIERREGFERYSPSSSLNRSTDTTRSSSAVLSTITPCVERPAMRMPDTGVRISLPASVTSIT